MIHAMARIPSRPGAACGPAVFEEVAAAGRAGKPARPPCGVFRREGAPRVPRTAGCRADRAGFDAHRAGAHVARAFAAATPLPAGPPGILASERVARPPEAP